VKGCNQNQDPLSNICTKREGKKKPCVVERIPKKTKKKQNKRLRMRESVCGEETLNKIENKDEKKKEGHEELKCVQPKGLKPQNIK
jgi:hypothetical protein